MLSFQECRSVIFEAVSVCETETISVRQSMGRVLAEDLVVPRDYPDTRLSAVDGYAVRFGSSNHFENRGVVAAGSLPNFKLEAGQSAAVMTGATVPEGSDCVIRVEDCEEVDEIVRTPIDLKKGDLINEIAYETSAGSPLAQKGVRIKHSLYPALFYAGISRIKVYKRPRVGVLMTGNELREVEDGPVKGQVFNTNLYTIESALDALGIKCMYQETVPDDEAATRKALDSMAEKCDFIISSGGVSMGRYDFIKKVFKQTDFSLLIQGTPIKPGRPLMVAEREGKLFFGIPGYPSAFFVNTFLYLVPALKIASGRIDHHYHLFDATLTTPMKSRKGRLYLNRIALQLDEGKWTARNAESQKTSHFLNFANVNGLAYLPEDVGDLDAGETIKALHFDLELS